VKDMKNYLIRKESMTGEIRKKQAWLRIAYTRAKLNKRDLQSDDYIQAVELLNPGEDLRAPLEAVRDGDMERLLN